MSQEDIEKEYPEEPPIEEEEYEANEYPNDISEKSEPQKIEFHEK